jgi:hypothetical protein
LSVVSGEKKVSSRSTSSYCVREHRRPEFPSEPFVTFVTICSKSLRFLLLWSCQCQLRRKLPVSVVSCQWGKEGVPRDRCRRTASGNTEGLSSHLNLSLPLLPSVQNFFVSFCYGVVSVSCGGSCQLSVGKRRCPRRSTSPYRVREHRTPEFLSEPFVTFVTFCSKSLRFLLFYLMTWANPLMRQSGVMYFLPQTSGVSLALK